MLSAININIMKSPLLQALIILGLLGGCASYEQFRYITEEFEMPQKIYKADFNQTWQAVLQVVKRYDIALQNQEAGVIKTRWMDNTQEVNFQNSFKKSDSVKAARFRIIVNVVKGYRSNREVSKITIFKRQMIEQDFLQGWKELPSDNILEKTLLYRIGNLVQIDNKLKDIDRIREQKELDNF